MLIPSWTSSIKKILFSIQHVPKSTFADEISFRCAILFLNLCQQWNWNGIFFWWMELVFVSSSFIFFGSLKNWRISFYLFLLVILQCEHEKNVSNKTFLYLMTVNMDINENFIFLWDFGRVGDLFLSLKVTIHKEVNFGDLEINGSRIQTKVVSVLKF